MTKKYGIIAGVVAIALIVGLVIWGTVFKNGGEASAELAGGITATAVNPDGGKISIEAVPDTGALSDSLPEGAAVLAMADFTLDGQFPEQWQEIRFELPETDTQTNYVIGHYDDNGRWEFVPTKLEGNTLVAKVSHFSFWGVISDSLTHFSNFLMESTGMKAPMPQCADTQPPWSNILGSSNETALLTWCAQGAANGGVHVKLVNNVSWPLPVKFAVKPDNAIDTALTTTDESEEESEQSEGEADVHWLAVGGTQTSTLVIPAGASVNLSYSEATIAGALKGEDKELFGVDYDHYAGYALFDTIVDTTSIFVDLLAHLSTGLRARLVSMMIGGGGDACQFATDDFDGAYDCWDNFLDMPVAESLEYGVSTSYTWDFLQDHEAGKSAGATLRSYFNPAPTDLLAAARAIWGFGTGLGQVAKVGLGWGEPVPALIFTHNRHFVDYMKNHEEWTDYTTADGRLTFQLPPQWKVEQTQTEGFMYFKNERNVLKVVDEDSKDVALLLTGLAPTGLDAGPDTTTSEETTHFPAQALSPENLALPTGSNESIEFSASTDSLTGEALAVAGLLSIEGAGANNGNPIWAYSANSGAYFWSQGLTAERLSNNDPWNFDRTPEFFELRRMMSSVRFVAETEPEEISLDKWAEHLVDSSGGSAQTAEGTVEEPPQAKEAEICTGSRFTYDTANIGCSEAKNFVQTLLEADSGGAGGYEISGFGSCYMNNGNGYDCTIEATGQEFTITSH